MFTYCFDKYYIVFRLHMRHQTLHYKCYKHLPLHLLPPKVILEALRRLSTSYCLIFLETINLKLNDFSNSPSIYIRIWISSYQKVNRLLYACFVLFKILKVRAIKRTIIMWPTYEIAEIISSTSKLNLLCLFCITTVRLHLKYIKKLHLNNESYKFHLNWMS